MKKSKQQKLPQPKHKGKGVGIGVFVKINERFNRYDKIGESDIYRKFKEQFDNLFNAEEVANNDNEFEKVYVPDKEFEDQLEVLRNSRTNMAKFCIGYTGIGKSTSIRYCFGLGVSKEAHINKAKKELVFPTFLDGYQVEDISKFDLSTRIAAVCTALEEHHPQLKELLATDDGKKEFYTFKYFLFVNFKQRLGFLIERKRIIARPNKKIFSI